MSVKEKVDSFGDSIAQKGQTHAMELIMFPIFFLLLTGVVANNFSSSGIQTVPTLPTPTCPNVGICYVTNNNGCDVNTTANCNLNVVSSFSFLNPNSPFTTLLQGNILGFMAGLFNGGEIRNRISAGYTTCIPLINNKYANQSNVNPNIHNLECLGQTATGNASVPPIFPQTGIPLNATSNGGNNSQWSITGCNLVNNVYPCVLNSTSPSDGFQAWNGTNSVMSFYGFYIKNGTSLNAQAPCFLYTNGSSTTCRAVLPFLFRSSPTFTCPSTHKVNGININATSYFCLIPTINPTTSTSSLPNTFSGLSFLFGAVLFFIGLGFAITSAFIGFSINEQGTKLAQVFGIGITIWSFIFGEFSGWLAFLGFGLNTIIIVSLSAMFFFGLYWRTFDFN